MILYADELVLARRAAEGDNDAFEEIVRQNQTYIYNLCFSKLGSREDALDVSQETFIKAYRALGSYRGESKLSSWLYRICANCITDHIRSKKQDTVSLEPDEEGNGGVVLADDDPGSSPEAAAERADIRSAVQAAVAALPEDMREMIILREYRGMSYAEIAELCGIEEGTVKSRLNRAKQKIKDFLTERNYSL